MPDRICLIHTSVDSEEAAGTLARQLVDQHLAACVQIVGPGQSLYRWQGRCEQAGEYYLAIKTSHRQCSAATAWLEGHHPYELPEIVWHEIAATPAYRQWVESETA